MISATLLYVLTFFLFLATPGAVTGTMFLASTVGYLVVSFWQDHRAALL